MSVEETKGPRAEPFLGPARQKRRNPQRRLEKEQPVKRKTRNILKANRRKYLEGRSDQLCSVA